MDTYDNSEDKSIKLETALTGKLKNELLANTTTEDKRVYHINLFKEFHKDTIAILKEIRSDHNLSLSLYALEIYKTLELQNASTVQEKNFYKKEVAHIKRCHDMVNKCIINPSLYSSILLNNRPNFEYKNPLPSDVVTKTLVANYNKFSIPLRITKGNKEDIEFYTELQIFTNSMLVDYQEKQIECLVYNKMVKEKSIERTLDVPKHIQEMVSEVAKQNRHLFKLGIKQDVKIDKVPTEHVFDLTSLSKQTK